MEFLQWLADSPVGIWVSSSETYGYYILLSVHAIGMGIVAGVILMLCARLLGFARDLSLNIFDKLFTIAKYGFFFNALSGAALFAANGTNLVKNVPFLLKLTFIVLGGIGLLLTSRSVERERAMLSNGEAASVKIKVLAFVTGLLWIAAILSGRIIAYTISY